MTTQLSSGEIILTDLNNNTIKLKEGSITIKDSSNNPITPTQNSHLSNKKYVDDSISSLSTTLTSSINTLSTTKQDNLIFDSTPTQNSNNSVKSGDIYLFTKQEIANLVNSAPSTLDTLSEIATALGSDANFSTTILNSLATKAPINNPTFTGTVSGISKAMVGLGNVDNTSDLDKPISNAVQSALNAKQNTLTIDATPTQNSTNPIQSNAVFNIQQTVNGLSAGNITNKRYAVNAGVQTLSTVLSSIQSSINFAQSVEIILSAGTHTNSSGAVFSFPNSTMYAVEGANAQLASLTGTFQIKQQDLANPLTRCRFSNIQFNGLVSITQSGSEINDGRHYFKACSFSNGFTLSGVINNWIYFYDCDFSGTTFTVPNTITGFITFYRCNMGTLSLNNVSPLQVIFIDCTNLPSFTVNGTLAGRNSTSTQSRLDATQIYQNGSLVALNSSLSSYLTTSSASSTYQPILTFDSVPTSGSTNILRSGGIFTALQNYALTSSLSNYLTTSSASSIYAPIANATHTGTLSTPNLNLTNISNTSTSNVLYYDTSTKSVSYGTAPSGGGGGSSYTSLTENSGASTLTLASPYQFNFGSFSVGLSNVSYTTSGVSHNTTFFRFGSAGLSFGASGNPYMRVSNISSSMISNNIFCFECYFYPTVATGNQTLWNLTTADNLEYIWIRMNSNRNLIADFGNNGSSYNGGSGAQSTNTLTLNTWNHCVFQYDGTGYQFYINGSRGLNYTQTGLNLPQSAFSQMYIGSYGLNNTPQDSVVSGYLDEIRFSNSARYSGTSFVVPTSAFSNDSNTLFLHHFNGSNGSTDFSVGQETPSTSATKGTLDASTGNIIGYNGTFYNQFKAFGSLGFGSVSSTTQQTSKSTAVSLDTYAGTITCSNSAVNATSIVNFVLTNNKITANDLVVISHISGGSLGAYTITATPGNGQATIFIRNNTGGGLSEAIVLKFCVITFG